MSNRPAGTPSAAPGYRQSIEQFGSCPLILCGIDIQTKPFKDVLQVWLCIQPAREIQGKRIEMCVAFALAPKERLRHKPAAAKRLDWRIRP